MPAMMDPFMEKEMRKIREHQQKEQAKMAKYNMKYAMFAPQMAYPYGAAPPLNPQSAGYGYGLPNMYQQQPQM